MHFYSYEEVAYEAALAEAQRTYSSTRHNTAFVTNTAGLALGAAIIMALCDKGMTDEEIEAIPALVIDTIIYKVLDHVGYNVKLLRPGGE